MSDINFEGIPERKRAAIAGVNKHGIKWRKQIRLHPHVGVVGNGEHVPLEHLVDAVNELGAILRNKLMPMLPEDVKRLHHEDYLEWMEDLKIRDFEPQDGEEAVFTRETALAEVRGQLTEFYDLMDEERILVVQPNRRIQEPENVMELVKQAKADTEASGPKF